jgi:hypothetical protein
MPRGIRKWTEELIARRIREGYGDGEGALYKPWISTAEFSSQGRMRISRKLDTRFA